MTDILLQIGATKLALACALGGAAWVVQRHVKRPATVHALWLMVLGAMLVPAVVPLRVLPGGEAVEAVGQPGLAMQPELAARSTAVPLPVPPEDAAEEAVVQPGVGPSVEVADAGPRGDAMAPSASLKQNGEPLAALLWFLGSAGFLGWTVVRTVRFQRTLTSAARPAPRLQRLAAGIGDTLGLRRVPRVYTTGARVRPMVWWAGGRVRILIPALFVAELDEAELRAVLAHELAHVRRRDYLVRVVELLACSAYWWNPVVWWAKRRMRSAEESSCDVLAVAASRLTRDRYAESLLRVVEIMSAVPIPRAPALASAADSCRDSKRLEQRLRTVLATASASPPPGGLRVAGAGALMCTLSLGLVYCTPGERQAFDPPLFTVTDSAGVRVVVNSGPQWGEGEGWQVTAEPVVTLGVRDYPVEQQFERLGGATRLSDGTIVVLEERHMELEAFDASGTLLWTAGGIGDGPGETRPYPDTRAVLTKLPGNTLQLQNGQDRVRFGLTGELIEHRKVDYARFRRWGRIFLQYCPFDVYFVRDHIVVCHGMQFEPPFPDSWAGRHTIMRTTWDLDRLDTLGTFLDANFYRAGPPGVAVRSPLAAQGMFRVATSPEPRLLYARNDAYRIEFWDIPAGNLGMVVERRVPRRAWSREEADHLVQSGDLGIVRLIANEMNLAIDMQAEADKAHSAAIDSVSIAEALFLDELGYLWVRRSPSQLDGEHARVQEVTGPDDTRWTLPAPTGLHDVFRPDGVYLGAVKLPPDLGITEIGPDYILGIVRDETDVQFVWMYGLDRGGGGRGLLGSTAGSPIDLQQSPTPVMTRDSARIRIVEHAGAPDRSAPFALAADPRYRHGDNPGDYRFRYIYKGALFADGSAVVTDATNNETIVLSSDGTVHDVLASGRGRPGNFHFEEVLAMGHDSVIVAHKYLNRVTVFARGSAVRSVDTRSADGFALQGIGASGHLLLSTGGFRSGFEEEWLPGHLARLDLQTGVVDTVASYDFMPYTPRRTYNPFVGFGHVTVAGGQFVYTRSDRPEITWRLPDGTIRQIVRWQPERTYATEEHLRPHEQRLLDNHRRDDPSASRAILDERVKDDMTATDVRVGFPLPLFRFPFGDAEGRVWLPRNVQGGPPHGSPPYTVIARDGEWLGTVDAPLGLQILDVAHGYVLGVKKDETRRESVVVYELIER